jgi:prepilin-type N-terminal cleavage/methylation domain-containing protein
MKINNKGFTLLELLVVIAIIGLLSTFAIVSLNSGREKARDTKRLSDMKNLQTAMEFYYDDEGDYNVEGTVADAVSDLALTDYIPQIAQMEDPSGTATLCTAASSGTCDYSFVNATASTYMVRFRLETANNAIGTSAAANCTATENGVTCS